MTETDTHTGWRGILLALAIAAGGAGLGAWIGSYFDEVVGGAALGAAGGLFVAWHLGNRRLARASTREDEADRLAHAGLAALPGCTPLLLGVVALIGRMLA